MKTIADSETTGSTEVDTDVCWSGNFEIETAADLAEIQRYTCVDGDLRIIRTELDMITLPNLISVSGDLRISGLENVRSVSGDIWLYKNAALQTLDGLDNLIDVGGALNIDHNPSLTAVSALDNLERIGGDFKIFYNLQLSEIASLTKLAEIKGNFLYRWGPEHHTQRNTDRFLGTHSPDSSGPKCHHIPKHNAGESCRSGQSVFFARRC